MLLGYYDLTNDNWKRPENEEDIWLNPEKF
jgi:hypothetical protein